MQTRAGSFKSSDVDVVSTLRKLSRITNPTITSRCDRQPNWTLVEEFWLRYHFVIFAAP
jgi:hypothetical protein